eukprot:m51a1_g6018 hypothetical protein (153) ;mRNA; r:77806-78361
MNSNSAQQDNRIRVAGSPSKQQKIPRTCALARVARGPQEMIEQIEASTSFRGSSAVAFKSTCYPFTLNGSFECSRCHGKWSSGQAVLELWFNKPTGMFDIRVYGQQCTKCKRAMHLPCLDEDQLARIHEAFTRVLKTDPKKKSRTEKKSSHE